MTDVLDIDKLTPKDRVLWFNGNKHVMKLMTVRDYLFLGKTTREVSNYSEEDLDMALEKVIEMIVRMFPTIKVDELYDAPVDQVWALMNFTQGNVDTATDEAPDSVKN